MNPARLVIIVAIVAVVPGPKAAPLLLIEVAVAESARPLAAEAAVDDVVIVAGTAVLIDADVLLAAEAGRGAVVADRLVAAFARHGSLLGHFLVADLARHLEVVVVAVHHFHEHSAGLSE
jgi:hypothetical protein